MVEGKLYIIVKISVPIDTTNSPKKCITCFYMDMCGQLYFMHTNLHLALSQMQDRSGQLFCQHTYRIYRELSWNCWFIDRFVPWWQDSFKEELNSGHFAQKWQAECKGLVTRIACGLPKANISPLLAKHYRFCTVSLYERGHFSRGSSFLSHVRASLEEE